MAHESVRWSDDVHEVITGDITAAVAYITPAGGAVVTAVAPCGIERRDQGVVGFTTSLGFGKKLERIVRDPHVALAYHSREHGFSVNQAFVLAQGIASVDLTPSRARLEALSPQVGRYLGEPKRGAVWDRLLREYYQERVFVDIGVERMVSWPGLDAHGDPEVTGAAWPGPPAPQAPPKNGMGPRVDVDKAAGRIATLPHRVLAYRGADGFPVVTTKACACWRRRACSRRAGAAQACSPTHTARISSAWPPGSSPAGSTSPATERPSTRRTRPRASWRHRARTCCSSRTACSPSSGCGRPGATEPPRSWPNWPPRGPRPASKPTPGDQSHSAPTKR